MFKLGTSWSKNIITIALQGESTKNKKFRNDVHVQFKKKYNHGVSRTIDNHIYFQLRMPLH